MQVPPANSTSKSPQDHNFSKHDFFFSLLFNGLLSKKMNTCMAEYGLGGSMWPQGDVYSYGILLLQMFTGRRPTESMFSDGLNLHTFSKMPLPEHIMEIADSNLFRESDEAISNVGNQRETEGRMCHCLVSIARIGVACSEE